MVATHGAAPHRERLLQRLHDGDTNLLQPRRFDDLLAGHRLGDVELVHIASHLGLTDVEAEAPEGGDLFGQMHGGVGRQAGRSAQSRPVPASAAGPLAGAQSLGGMPCGRASNHLAGQTAIY
eukprot:366083-Chlamydomonas_euryale.AAC.26